MSTDSNNISTLKSCIGKWFPVLENGFRLHGNHPYNFLQRNAPCNTAGYVKAIVIYIDIEVMFCTFPQHEPHLECITLCYLVPSSRIRLMATAVAAPLHPALSLAYRLMLLLWLRSSTTGVCPAIFVYVFLSFSLHSFSRASRHLPSLLLTPSAQISLMQPLAHLTPVSIPV